VGGEIFVAIRLRRIPSSVLTSNFSFLTSQYAPSKLHSV
jgi:hypothetical protein